MQLTAGNLSVLNLHVNSNNMYSFGVAYLTHTKLLFCFVVANQDGSLFLIRYLISISLFTPFHAFSDTYDVYIFWRFIPNGLFDFTNV